MVVVANSSSEFVLFLLVVVVANTKSAFVLFLLMVVVANSNSEFVFYALVVAVSIVSDNVFLFFYLAGMNAVSSSPFLSFTDDQGEPLAIWVASTIEQIPPGSFIINPQTGKPYTNPDGSLYKWYPPQSACQDIMDAGDKKCVMGSSQYGLMTHEGQVMIQNNCVPACIGI